jgi:hypothetical protein
MNDLKDERIENLVIELSYLLGISKDKIFKALILAMAS